MFVPLIWFFLYCRWEYIRLGSKQDPTWRDFPQAISQEREEEEGDADVEMMEEEKHENGEPSRPQGLAVTEEVPPLVSAGDAVSPKEDAFLMQQASQPVDPAAGSHRPRSEAGTISGEMAELSLTSPSQPGPGEDETPQ